MDTKKLWDRYFENHKHPCFLNVKGTGELLYCNESILSLYGFTEDWKGRTFHDLISTDSIQSSKDYPDWDIQDIFETESYNKKMNQRFRIKSAKIFDNDTIFT